MSRQPRFEICRGDDGWWARFRAANGRVVWVTETYERRRAAERAIETISGMPIDWIDGKPFAYLAKGPAVKITEVDER